MEGAPFQVSDYMIRNWFECILYSFEYTHEEDPPYKDPFREVRQILRMWNENMEHYFTPGWITCLDESM